MRKVAARSCSTRLRLGSTSSTPQTCLRTEICRRRPQSTGARYRRHRPLPYPSSRSDHAVGGRWRRSRDLVIIGKVRYLGAFSMMAWEVAKALILQKANGWADLATPLLLFPQRSMTNESNGMDQWEAERLVPKSGFTPSNGAARLTMLRTIGAAVFVAKVRLCSPVSG